MSHAGPKPNPDLTCWDCGAANDPGASECWLCQRRGWRERPAAPAVKPNQGASLGVAVAALILLVLALVTIGGLAVAQGLVVVLLIFSLPAWAIAEVMATRRRRQGQPMSGREKTLWIVGLTMLIPILLAAALFFALYVYCLAYGP